MSAELLRQAAAVLRERAEIVGRAPWTVTHIDADIIPGTRDGQDEWFVMGSFDGAGRNPCGPFAVCDWEPSAAYIATMHPAVGLLVSALLAREAADLDNLTAARVREFGPKHGPDFVRDPDPLLIELARAILGGAS